MRQRPETRVRRQALGFVIAMVLPAVAAGQTPAPAAAPTPAPVAPSIRVGATVVADYTVTPTPKVIDANGNPVTLSGFNLTRSYINVIGTVTSRIAFRITPDIIRNTDAGSGLTGSLMFRVKYAYGQFRAGSDTIVRLGIQPTPLVDEQEAIYRYRFQGTMFSERDGGEQPSDAGLSVTTPLPKDHGTVHVGLYNGEGYTRSEVNDRKAVLMRASFRPAPTHAVAKGLRLIGYYHADNYVKGAPRTRAAASAMFEHKRLNAGVDFMRRVDQPTPASTEVTGRGYSVFVTPFLKEKGRGIEGLFRLDAFDPNTSVAGKRHRLITGVAYWFPRPGAPTTALMVHMEQVRQSGLTPAQTTDRKFALNLSINY